MVNKIEKVYPNGWNNGLILRSYLGSWVQHETLEEGRTIHRPKSCEYNNKDEGYTYS